MKQSEEGHLAGSWREATPYALLVVCVRLTLCEENNNNLAFLGGVNVLPGSIISYIIPQIVAHDHDDNYHLQFISSAKIVSPIRTNLHQNLLEMPTWYQSTKW